MDILQTNWFDWLVFGIYLVVVFSFGLLMSRREDTTADFFLAGRRLPWFAVALSLFATNISSGSFLGLAGDAFRDGLAVGVMEWLALFPLTLLAFVFLPYYQRRRIYTMPQFMEMRYNLAVRLIFGAAVLIFEAFINIPFLLYTGGLAIEVMFGIPLSWAVIAIAIFVGTYTILGGLGAVVWTDVIQGCLMIVGALTITAFGLHAIGGVDELFTQAREKMHVCLAADHPRYPFPASLIGGYLILSIYYWCLNQMLVQRTLGARSEWDARMGTMAACLIKLFLPFIIVVPGIIAFVLFPDLESADGDKALPLLIKSVLPVGMSGLILAAIIASLMSSADSALNSWATIFTYDFYQRLVAKDATPRRLIGVGRLAMVFVLLVSVTPALLLTDQSSIVQFLLTGLAYMACPVVVIFTVGIFWRRATSAGALTTMILSPIVCYVCQHMQDLFGFGFDKSSPVYWLIVATAVATVVMIAVSLFTRPKELAQLEGLIWNRHDSLTFGPQLLQRRDVENQEKMPGTAPRQLGFWWDYRLVGLLAYLIMILMIWGLR